MKVKFEIKNWTGSVVFTYESETLKQAVEAAVKYRANLSGASLSGANLPGRCYPGCKAVLPDVQSYYEHCELVHDAEDDGERGDLCYAEGLRREA